jgi:hypothetical protein
VFGKEAFGRVADGATASPASPAAGAAG